MFLGVEMDTPLGRSMLWVGDGKGVVVVVACGVSLVADSAGDEF